MKDKVIDWKLETDVDDWVKKQLESIKLVKLDDFNEKSAMTGRMKRALKGSSKTTKKTGVGQPDFHIVKYKVPIIIENKLHLKKLISETKKDGIKFDETSVRNYAVNGALYYATQMIASNEYNEVIAIAIAGDNEENVKIKVYYVFGSSNRAYKEVNYSTLDFLENDISFENFYKDCVLTDEEKHYILISSKDELNYHAQKLNRLMHNHNITAPQRVLYVSGMLLSMQGIYDKNGNKIQEGLVPDSLKGLQTNSNRDGILIYNQIKEFLIAKDIEQEKRELMLKSFGEICKDKQRDELTDLDKLVSEYFDKNASCNKQIFTYIFNNIYLSIDSMAGHLDIMGEMYSEFLKYALGDGKEIGIVLTPPYVTKMMVEILDVNMNSRVMDLATGSAGFLISSMEQMIEGACLEYGKGTTRANTQIESIKKIS